jgi:hypothetical protein
MKRLVEADGARRGQNLGSIARGEGDAAEDLVAFAAQEPEQL